LGELLNTLAGRLRKVDLRDIDEIRNLWPTIVEPVIAATLSAGVREERRTARECSIRRVRPACHE
jgi:hypothetical protein